MKLGETLMQMAQQLIRQRSAAMFLGHGGMIRVAGPEILIESLSKAAIALTPRPIETAPLGEKILAFNRSCGWEMVVGHKHADGRSIWIVCGDADNGHIIPSRWLPLPEEP